MAAWAHSEGRQDDLIGQEVCYCFVFFACSSVFVSVAQFLISPSCSLVHQLEKLAGCCTFDTIDSYRGIISRLTLCLLIVLLRNRNDDRAELGCLRSDLNRRRLPVSFFRSHTTLTTVTNNDIDNNDIMTTRRRCFIIASRWRHFSLKRRW